MFITFYKWVKITVMKKDKKVRVIALGNINLLLFMYYYNFLSTPYYVRFIIQKRWNKFVYHILANLSMYLNYVNPVM